MEPAFNSLQEKRKEIQLDIHHLAEISSGYMIHVRLNRVYSLILYSCYFSFHFKKRLRFGRKWRSK